MLKQPYLHLLVSAKKHYVAYFPAPPTPLIVGAGHRAHGLLQLLALRFGALVWQHHRLYLRTQSRALPAEKTVKQVLAPRLLQQFVHLPAISILQKIQHCFDDDPDDEDEKNRWAA